MKPRPYRKTKIIIYSLILLFLLYKYTPIASFLSSQASFNFQFYDPDLTKIIKSNLEGKTGEYAVIVEKLGPDAKPADKAHINETQQFTSGSLYKLFLMAAALEKVEKGELKLTDKIKVQQDHLEDVLGATDFGYDPSEDTVEYTIDQILRRIATISDNFASIMLAEKIGWPSVQDYANRLGTTQTVIKSPISTSAQDVSLFFRKLYRGEIVSASASAKITDLLSESKINNRIPSKLPPELKISHKTSELPRLRHDAGIVFLENNPYLIVLMSQKVQYEDSTVELLAKISKDVYDYMSKK